MKLLGQLSISKATAGRVCFVCGVLAGIPGRACAQAVDSAAATPVSIISVSPVELFYKAAVGYEHRTGPHSGLGLLGNYYYGNVGLPSGWLATGYFRHYFSRQFPVGWYIQVEASVLDFTQTISLVNLKSREYSNYSYRAVSGGGGVGFGYRTRLLRRLANGRLLGNALIGFRGHPRPQPTYDTSLYRQELSLLGPDFEWYMLFSPGSLAHGLLTLEYQF